MSKLYLVSLNKDTWVAGEAEEKGKYMETGCHKIYCQNAIDQCTGEEIICDNCRLNPNTRSNGNLFKKKYFEEIE